MVVELQNIPFFIGTPCSILITCIGADGSRARKRTKIDCPISRCVGFVNQNNQFLHTMSKLEGGSNVIILHSTAVPPAPWGLRCWSATAKSRRETINFMLEKHRNTKIITRQASKTLFLLYGYWMELLEKRETRRQGTGFWIAELIALERYQS